MGATAPAAILIDTGPTPSPITTRGLRNALGNVCLAASFFVAAVPNAIEFDGTVANGVWIVGAVIMGFFSLVRFPPRSVSLSVSAFASTTAMFLLPCLMRPHHASSGLISWIAVVVEIFGVVLSYLSRIYMGRSFGLLPANRGVVSRGPFQWIRHPIYAGWLILTAGYAVSYPTPANIAITLATLPYMLWRIRLEEDLLTQDPEYREYQQRVRYKLLPGLI